MSSHSFLCGRTRCLHLSARCAALMCNPEVRGPRERSSWGAIASSSLVTRSKIKGLPMAVLLFWVPAGVARLHPSEIPMLGPAKPSLAYWLGRRWAVATGDQRPCAIRRCAANLRRTRAAAQKGLFSTTPIAARNGRGKTAAFLPPRHPCVP